MLVRSLRSTCPYGTLTRYGRHPMRHRLRYSGAGKAGPTIQGCTTVRIWIRNSQPSQSSDQCASSVARDPRFERLSCSHPGTYADDCLVQRVTSHRCYIVATCDRELRRRIRKIPGVPLMYIVNRRYSIEKLPDGGAPI